MTTRTERVVIALAAAYVIVAGWAMQRTTYDTWGAMVVAPLLALVTWPLLRRAFAGELVSLFPIAVAGLVAKLGGALFRYWVAFGPYGGSADASRYHQVGAQISDQIRAGAVSPTAILPRTTGTAFIDELTGLIYTFIGASRLSGFLVFSWFGFWGAVLFVRAAVVGVPELDRRRYALFVFLVPSLLYWPSSIGKESWMLLCLGAATYGGARLLAGNWSPRALTLAVVGTVGAGFVRPHFAALWVGAYVVAFLAGAVGGGRERRATIRASAVLLAIVAGGALTLAASATLRYLDPPDDEPEAGSVSQRVISIFDETERRTVQGGSSFEPIDTNNPASWPYAVTRTLTRPLIYEARNTFQWLPAVEMTAILTLAAVGWRRLANLPQMLLRHPFVVFAMAVLIMFGIAFSSIGNLGMLTRQRSLVVPFLLLPLCLPPRPPRRVPSYGAPRVAAYERVS